MYPRPGEKWAEVQRRESTLTTYPPPVWLLVGLIVEPRDGRKRTKVPLWTLV